MRRTQLSRSTRLLSIAAVAAVGAASLAACSDDKSDSGGGDKVGVILPDSASSARWETADRPLLEKAFKDAGVGYDIQNAGGDVNKFSTIADGMISSKVKVLMMVNLDSDSGAAVIKKATAAGIPVIDYDRLTLGGGANYYVSFDNVLVGTKIGEGLVKGMKANGKNNGPVVLLDGSPTDNNATLFSTGYKKAITDAGYTVAAQQAVKDWDNQQALTDFEQIFTKLGAGGIDGVAAANDGLAGSVASVLAKNNLTGKIPVTGQDATDEGLQRVLLGSQYVTIYKAIKKEADAASQLAIKIIKGDKAGADALATAKSDDTVTKKQVPSILLTPQPIYKENVKDVVADGFTTKDKICTTAELKAACAANGIN
ncbi:sugar ABC transporter substrate-binding protein [Williamsia sp. CHRR-6]|uniref:sugar ABC transporter substrate-binding protein n=1 Tax=Williamsia sp. CHRR-6 TaxID=2835871 RepID=UPI001BD91479|nr:substrate-binding domain-containing protein [Williamsia sp. CHRR-6]MBT0565816.1 substrate-binding domain-containing protein [Williamsia sp. CHRR-6]